MAGRDMANRDMAGRARLRRLSAKRSRLRPAPRWSGSPGTGAGADTAGFGCPAATPRGRTRAPLGCPVTGANGTGAGFGCRDIGDETAYNQPITRVDARARPGV